jgi:hypothetical protein
VLLTLKWRASRPCCLAGSPWMSMSLTQQIIRLSVYSCLREKDAHYRLYANCVYALKVHRNSSVLHNTHVHRKHQSFVYHCWMVHKFIVRFRESMQIGGICFLRLALTNSFCLHSVYMCFLVALRTAIIYLYSINWLVFITERQCVYCAVRTGSLYIIQDNPGFKR